MARGVQLPFAMRTLLAALVATVGLGGVATANSSGELPDSAVIGGEAVAEGEWPDAVALVDGGVPFCSGTLIAEDLVLTAAHCVADGVTPQVRVDTLDGYSGPTTEVARVHIHPAWETTFDAAVLELQTPVRGVAPRPLVPGCARSELVDGARVTVAGFGIRGLDFDAPDGDLYAADLQIASLECPTNEGCNAQVRPDGELIAAGRVGVDSCYGDSGGPLYLRSSYGSFLAGVVSRATYTATADCGEGGIYVRADSLAGWIEETTGRALPAGSCEALDSGGGCSAAGGSGFGPIALLLLGLFAIIRRRR